ncbi:MAG: hypothetical protein RMK57_07345 [Bryobacterales bacterium]|nr:hypothetical protein [Bryobacterales bacterium]
MWDLRVPSGWFFALVGAILCVHGLLAPGARAPLAETNVNLYAGLVMLVFGGALLWLARRAS